MRLNRYLAQAGLGSRRAVEQIILSGEVAINGHPARDLATQVDPERDRVTVGGDPVRPATRLEYLLLNKPRGYDVTRGGEHHHRRAWDLLPPSTHPSVQSVGRLDRDSTGLLLFTNDGELAFRLAHPSHGCRKTYEVDVEGKVDAEVLEIMCEGIQLEDGPAHAVSAERLDLDLGAGISRLRIVMEEGRKRIVRRMCERAGHAVLALNRTALGPIQLGTLPRGRTRPLSAREVNLLRQSVGLEPVPPAVNEQRLHAYDDHPNGRPSSGRPSSGRGSSPRPGGSPRPGRTGQGPAGNRRQGAPARGKTIEKGGYATPHAQRAPQPQDRPPRPYRTAAGLEPEITPVSKHQPRRPPRPGNRPPAGRPPRDSRPPRKGR